MPDCADVHENVSTAGVRLNESKPFVALNHFTVPVAMALTNRPANLAQPSSIARRTVRRSALELPPRSRSSFHALSDTIAIESTVTEWPLAARCQFEVVRGSDGEDLGRTRLSLNRDRNVLIVSVVLTLKSYRSWPRPMPRISALRPRAPSSASSPRRSSRWCSSFRMRFEFLNVFHQGWRCAVVFFVGTNNLPSLMPCLRVKRGSVIASPSQNDIVREFDLRRQRKIFFLSLGARVLRAAPPSSRKKLGLGQRPGHAARPTAL